MAASPKVGKFISFVVFIIVVEIVHGQMLFSGWCPDQDAMHFFDRHRYLGLWYENQRYFTLFEAGGRCMTILHEDAGDGRFAVTNSMVDWLGKQVTASGFASKIDTKGPIGAKYNLRYYSNPFLAFASKGDEDGNYWVLDTDYDNYAIVWDCNNKFFSNTQFLWILTRVRHPHDWEVDRALWELERRGLDTSKLKTTDHTGCPPPFDFDQLGYEEWNTILAPPLDPHAALPGVGANYGVGAHHWVGDGVTQWPSLPYYNFWGRLDGNASVAQGGSAGNKSSIPQLEESTPYLQYTPLPAINISHALTQKKALPQSSHFREIVTDDNSSNALNIGPLPETKSSQRIYKKIAVAREEPYAKVNMSKSFENGWKASDYRQVLQLRSFH